MTLIVLGVVLALVAVPFAVWQTIGVVRSQRANAVDRERAPEPRYGADEPHQPQHSVGKAWTRTTTHVD